MATIEKIITIVIVVATAAERVVKLVTNDK